MGYKLQLCLPAIRIFSYPFNTVAIGSPDYKQAELFQNWERSEHEELCLKRACGVMCFISSSYLYWLLVVIFSGS